MSEDADRLPRSRSSGATYLIGGRAGVGLITLASTIITARLLLPHAYGIAAMALVFTGFLGIFRDAGMSQAILRKGHIDEAEISFLFWFNCAATTVLAAALAFLARPLSDYYQTPEVRTVIFGLIPSFVIAGIATQHGAILHRNMRFAAISTISITSALAGFVIGVTVAFVRRDVWAIIASATAQATVSAFLTIALAKWKPSKPGRISGLRDVLSFGTNSTAFSLLNYLSASLPAFVLGSLFGPAPLGHFSRAQTLFSLPINTGMSPIIQATMPIMTRQRADPPAYRETYLQLLGRLNCIMLPGSCLLIFAAEPAVITVLGARWAIAGTMLAVLAPALIAYGINAPTVDLLISQNRSAALRMQGVYDFACRALGVLAGLPFGPIAIVAGYSIATLLLAPLHVTLTGRQGPVTARDQWQAIAPALPIGLAAAIGGLAGRWLSNYADLGPFWTLISTVGAGLATIFTLLALNKKSRNMAVSLWYGLTNSSSSS